MMLIDEEEYLAHYGTPRRSGRYPWGSGDNVETRRSFIQMIKDLLGKGMTEKEVADGFGMTVKELRSAKSIALEETKAADIAFAQRLRDKGTSIQAIADRMGRPESSVRTLLAPGAQAKAEVISLAADMLQRQVDKKGFIDVGKGVENNINLSREKLDAALYLLEQKGYPTHTNLPVKRLGTTKETNLKVLAPPGTEWSDIRYHMDKINQIDSRVSDTGKSVIGIYQPKSIDSKRVGIVYGPDGGSKQDGVIYLRPGVEDLSLDGASYAQARIQVGDGHYLKGMALYSDDLPSGVDVLFHTNKKDTGNKLDALKELERNPLTGEIDGDNPFGTQIKRQITKEAADGSVKVTSAVNIVYESGDWNKWSDSIAAQVLAKQPRKLAKDQLKMTYDRKVNELDEIMALTNPTVKRKLLEHYALEVDAAAVHLKAAALPRQGWHVILPLNSLKETEVYAPGYKDGERVVLVRYPHGGTFEIPELVVNNRNVKGRSLLGNTKDAIGINAAVAERLSGADFDGDTVLVIPNNTGRVKSTKALDKLQNFDPKLAYPSYPGMKVMSDTQKQMGVISNLITDMTVQGAKTDEIVRAVKHSMVVIDAEKHELNYKQSYNDNGIKALQDRYQPKIDGKGGASTLISRAGAEIRVPEMKPRPAKDGGPINKKTGELEFVPTGKTHWKTGKPILKKFSRLEITKDANELSSGQVIETIYAEHSNSLKQLANNARLAMINTPRAKWNPSAKETYKNEVARLDAALSIAKANAPKERQAHLVAGVVIAEKKKANPNMAPEVEKKMSYQALNEARERLGAKKDQIEISPKEWEAIQAGAISDSKVVDILNNANMEVVKEYATPKNRLLMSSSKKQRAQAMLASGYTRAQVAAQLGVSVSTLDRSLDG